MRPYRQDQYLEMARLTAFSDVMSTRPGSLLLTGEFAPETIRAVEVSTNAFRFLGVRPLFGRTIEPSDLRPSGEPEPVAVLSYLRWQRLFGTNTNILGKTLRLDDQAYTIIGVMPPRFGWWTDNGLWVPMGIDSRNQLSLVEYPEILSFHKIIQFHESHPETDIRFIGTIKFHGLIV